MKENLLRFARHMLTIVLFALPSASYADAILTITANGASEACSFEELAAIPQTKVVTKNDYTDNSVEFTGPRLRDVLAPYEVGPNKTLIMRAINDFAVNIPASDAFEYDVILALFSNGEKMSIREKGPIWVIYPMDDHPELRDDSYNSRLVWQLVSITVE